MKKKILKKLQQREDDNMPAVIEEIVRVQRNESDRYIEIQKKRIKYLENIKEKSCRKQTKEKIIRELQSSGILDKNGNLSKNYR